MLNKFISAAKKKTDKIYQHHTGYPGGLRSISYKELVKKDPTAPLKKAVKNMLPRGPLGRQMFNKFKVYGGSEHPHIAQQPQELNLTQELKHLKN